MNVIKLYFVNFWKGFNQVDNFIYNCLSQLGFELQIDDVNPDYLFYSSQGQDHLKYKNCIKIYFTGENDVPNFNECDYAISFHHIDFGKRHLRFPLYILTGDCHNRIKRDKNIIPELVNRKFCNFVYSNSNLADPFREFFFRELSKYKKIDSGGRLLNNIGSPVQDKLSFIKDYKFTISFENSSVRGYTTEKIIEPMSVDSMPIYWGNPEVNLDFNVDSFLWIKDKTKVKEMIDYIVYLDENDDQYLKKLSEPWLTDNQLKQDWHENLSVFIQNIISQTYDDARMTTDYGFVRLINERNSSPIKRVLSLFRN